MALVDSSSSGGFEPYAGQVYGWAYRFLGRHHDALDVVQDVFLRWDQQCSQARPLQPRGWLRRVTLNRAIDVSRKRQTGADSMTPMMKVPTADDAAVEPMDRSTRKCTTK
jgi:DNA-directed RNA polymerase specialized sigma24 family protein